MEPITFSFGILGLAGLLGLRTLGDKLDDAEARASLAHVQADTAIKAQESAHLETLMLRQALTTQKLQKWMFAGVGIVGMWLWLKRYDDIEVVRDRVSQWVFSLRTIFLKKLQIAHFELRDVIYVDKSTGKLGQDFDIHVYDEASDEHIRRVVRIQCTGVTQADVRIEVIYNGCIVHIDRSSSPGLSAAKWTKRIQFPVADDIFEFKEECVQLDSGILQFEFQTCRQQPRVVRLQQTSPASALAIQVTPAPGASSLAESFVHIEAASDSA